MRKRFQKVISILLTAVLVVSMGQFGQIAIAAEGTEPTNTLAFEKEEIIYHETFENGIGKVIKSGDANITHVTDKVFEGNDDGKAIYVDNRSKTYDAVDFSYEDMGLVNGKTYKVTVSGFVYAGENVPQGAQAVLLKVDGFKWIANIDYVAGEAFKLEGEFTIDSDNDTKLRIQSNDDGAEVSFYIGDIIVSQKPEAPTETVVEVYHETFEDGIGKATVSGGAKITPVTDKVFDGNEDGAALYVENRSQTWDAVDFFFEDIGLKSGETYTITVTGFVDEGVDVPAGSQAYILKAEKDYAFVASDNYVAGQAFKLTSTFTIDSDEYTRLRIQSNDDGKTVPFYIGDIVIVHKQKVPTETIVKVYQEGFEDGIGKATVSGGAKITPVTDKVFDGNEDGAALYVENRSQTWDAVDFFFEDIGLKSGETYTITVTGFVDEGVDVPAGSQAFVLKAEKDYAFVASDNYVAGQAFKLTSTFTIDSDEYTRLRIQSNEDGKTVPFYIGDILITKKVMSGERPPREPSLPFTTIDFEDQSVGGFVGRGGVETLTVTDEDNHTDGGKYALKLEGRAQNWQGPSIRVEKYVDEGYEYKVSVWVKLISPNSTRITLSTQVGSSSPSYNNIMGQNISTSDGWVQLEGKYRYNNATDEFLQVYIETASAEDCFYIDDFSFERTGAGKIEIQKDLVPIKDKYSDKFLIGTAVSATDLEGVRLELLKHHFNVVTAENAMKPDYHYDENRKFNADSQNTFVDKIQDEGLQLVGHVLVWHQQMPTWLSTAEDGQPLDKETARENLETHIRAVMENYGDSVISWDVVNEAIKDGLTTTVTTKNWKTALRESPWYNALGPDYVEESFRIAKQVLKENPEWKNVKLYYNDYNEDNQQKAAAIYSMVKDINERYAEENNGEILIDGIGMQSHYNSSTNIENVRLSLEKFSSLEGVEISVTELDVTAGSNATLTKEQATGQAYLYAQLFKLYEEYADKIVRVTIWGLNDSTSWRKEGSPLLFDADMQAKLAYYAIMDPDKFIKENPPKEKVIKQGKALFGTPVIDGKVDDVWQDGYSMKVDQYQQAWQGATGVAKALWDRENLYVLVQVQDDSLDDANVNPWEQDSIEIFVDQNNAKTPYYEEEGDGQYRINFKNIATFNPESIAEGFESATYVAGTTYTVEVKIPLNTITPSRNKKIGFDVQINDAKSGARISAAAWNDVSGTGYMDTSVFGELTLVEATTPGSDGSGSGGSGGSKPAVKDNVPGDTDQKEENDKTTVEATVDEDGNYTAVVNKEAVQNVEGGKVKIEVKGAEQGNSITVKLDYEIVNAVSEANAKTIEVDTGFANVELPISLFSGSKEGEEIELQVNKVDKALLSDDVGAKVGQNTVYEFSLRVGGQKLSDFGIKQKVKVSYPYSLAAGVRPGRVVVYYINDNGNFEVIKNGRYSNGAIHFNTKHFSKYVAIPVEISLKDIYEATWATDSIEALAAREIVKGVSADSFLPMKEVTRAEFVQMIVEAFDLKSEAVTNPFSDVEEGAWYQKAVLTAYELGIVKGKPDGTFGVNEKITRQDMAVITYSALKAAGININASGTVSFADGITISEYAKEAVAAMQKAGIINGMPDGTFAPKDTANRAQAAVILAKLLEEL